MAWISIIDPYAKLSKGDVITSSDFLPLNVDGLPDRTSPYVCGLCKVNTIVTWGDAKKQNPQFNSLWRMVENKWRLLASDEIMIIGDVGLSRIFGHNEPILESSAPINTQWCGRWAGDLQNFGYNVFRRIDHAQNRIKGNAIFAEELPIP